MHGACARVCVCAQVLASSVIVLLFALLGFLSPANRGGLITTAVVLFVSMGMFAGYFSTRLYKKFKGQVRDAFRVCGR
jgi:transmembrane 9 superfamily protein 2/4